MQDRQLQSLLLEMLSPNAIPEGNELSSLSSQDWETLRHWVRDKRLAPLLDWTLRRKKRLTDVPVSVRELLQSDRKHSVFRNLMIAAELQEIARLLDREDIPYQALKGAYLSTRCYPEAGLRPMRDIDILVPADKVMAAYELLVKKGWQPPEEALVVFNPKHLPALMSPNRLVQLELHQRLSPTHFIGGDLPDMTASPGYWQRTVEADVGGQRIKFPSPTDTLLHLIRHAVIDHSFENGPLTLSDLAYILGRKEIDWPLFWENARLVGALRPASIAFALLERFWGPQDLKWPEDLGDAPLVRASPHCVEVAARLLFRDGTRQLELSLINDLDSKGTILGKSATIYRRLFPTRAEMIRMYELPPDAQSVWRQYPRHLHRLVRHRAPAFFKSKNFDLHRADNADLLELNQWLTADATEVQSPTA